VEELAWKLLGLQKKGCHNVNLVTATHFLPWVVRALRRAAQSGCRSRGLQLRRV